jgi:thioredoxin reductase (NADPH)
VSRPAASALPSFSFLPSSSLPSPFVLRLSLAPLPQVLGFHYLGPNAGEITQGLGIAIKKGVTYEDLMSTVGIHPTVAEEFTTCTVAKSSGESAEKGGC